MVACCCDARESERERQTDRQTDRQTETETETETKKERETERENKPAESKTFLSKCLHHLPITHKCIQPHTQPHRSWHSCTCCNVFLLDRYFQSNFFHSPKSPGTFLFIVYPFIHPSVRPSACPPARLPACLSVCISIYLSIPNLLFPTYLSLPNLPLLLLFINFFHTCFASQQHAKCISGTDLLWWFYMMHTDTEIAGQTSSHQSQYADTGLTSTSTDNNMSRRLALGYQFFGHWYASKRSPNLPPVLDTPFYCATGPHRGGPGMT